MHKSGIERPMSKQKREKNIVDALKKYDESHPVGETCLMILEYYV